jgi:hypothetical protein
VLCAHTPAKQSACSSTRTERVLVVAGAFVRHSQTCKPTRELRSGTQRVDAPARRTRSSASLRGYSVVNGSWFMSASSVEIELPGRHGGVGHGASGPPRQLPPDRQPAQGDLILLTGGISLLVLGVQQGNQWGWASAATLTCISVGVTAIAGFTAMQLRSTDPLLNVRLFARRPFMATPPSWAYSSSGCSRWSCTRPSMPKTCWVTVRW